MNPEEPSDFEHKKFQHLPLKVKQLLEDRVLRSGDFVSLPTLHLEDDIEKYGKQLREYTCPGSLEEVWDAYTLSKPEEVWGGPMVNFLFSYSERDHKLYYTGDPDFPRFHLGQQFYCWINILGPRLVVGFKLMRIDPNKKELEIAYLKGGMYRGTQILSFSEAGDNTQITHKSYFRSASWFMDAYIYPFFHNLTTGEHHKAVYKKMQKPKAGKS